MNQVTHILAAIEQGDPRAPEKLLPLVYDELRKLAAQRLAQERPGQMVEQPNHSSSGNTWRPSAASGSRDGVLTSASRR